MPAILFGSCHVPRRGRVDNARQQVEIPEQVASLQRHVLQLVGVDFLGALGTGELDGGSVGRDGNGVRRFANLQLQRSQFMGFARPTQSHCSLAVLKPFIWTERLYVLGKTSGKRKKPVPSRDGGADGAGVLVG